MSGQSKRLNTAGKASAGHRNSRTSSGKLAAKSSTARQLYKRKPSKAVLPPPPPTPPEQIKYIMAQSFDRAEEWAREHGLVMSDWIFCHDVSQLVTLQISNKIVLLYKWQVGKTADFIKRVNRLIDMPSR